MHILKLFSGALMRRKKELAKWLCCPAASFYAFYWAGWFLFPNLAHPVLLFSSQRWEYVLCSFCLHSYKLCYTSEKAFFLTEPWPRPLHSFQMQVSHSDPIIFSVYIRSFQNGCSAGLTLLFNWQSIVACVSVCDRDLQERGLQSTGCSAWRLGLCYKGSPALLQWMCPTVAEKTAQSRSPPHTRTGHFHETWREEGQAEGKSIKEGGKVRLKKEQDTETKSS